jgi:hypothetical protein
VAVNEIGSMTLDQRSQRTIASARPKCIDKGSPPTKPVQLIIVPLIFDDLVTTGPQKFRFEANNDILTAWLLVVVVNDQNAERHTTFYPSRIRGRAV